MLLFFIVLDYTIDFYFCINQTFENFKHMTRPNLFRVCNKDTEDVSADLFDGSFQCLPFNLFF